MKVYQSLLFVLPKVLFSKPLFFGLLPSKASVNAYLAPISNPSIKLWLNLVLSPIVNGIDRAQFLESLFFNESEI